SSGGKPRRPTALRRGRWAGHRSSATASLGAAVTATGTVSPADERRQRQREAALHSAGLTAVRLWAGAQTRHGRRPAGFRASVARGTGRGWLPPRRGAALP